MEVEAEVRRRMAGLVFLFRSSLHPRGDHLFNSPITPAKGAAAAGGVAVGGGRALGASLVSAQTPPGASRGRRQQFEHSAVATVFDALAGHRRNATYGEHRTASSCWPGDSGTTSITVPYARRCR